MIDNISELAKKFFKNAKAMRTKDYQIVGVTFEGRQEILKDFYKNYKVGKQYEVVLMPENNNPYDKNAIAVALEVNDAYQCVGYISKDENVDLRKNFDYIDNVKLKSIGVGGTGNIGLSIKVTFDFSKDNESSNADDEVAGNASANDDCDISGGCLALNNTPNLGLVVKALDDATNQTIGSLNIGDIVTSGYLIHKCCSSMISCEKNDTVNVDGVEVDMDKLIECYRNANKGM